MRKLLSVVLVMIAALCQAQSLDKFVVASAGNIQSKSNMVNSFTIGESLVMPMPKSNLEARNGFQQKTTGFGVGVNDFKLISVSVFPNPFNDELIVQGSDLNLIKEITLINMTGQKIALHTHHYQSNHQLKMNTSQLSAGVYVLQIIQSSGVCEFTRVVKQ